jgi:hypothetical protein
MAPCKTVDRVAFQIIKSSYPTVREHRHPYTLSMSEVANSVIQQPSNRLGNEALIIRQTKYSDSLMMSARKYGE